MTHSLRGLLNDGDRVVSFVGAPVTEAGTRIGFPPLHVHHVHVRKPERSGAMQPPVGRERASHWFETHGDYSRGDDFGVGARSAAGYATRLPEGHCYVVTSAEQIDLNAEVNDVRVDASGASELSYYLEAAFTLAPDADCKPVSKFWLRRPRSRELPTDVWERYAAPSTDSVTWWSGKMPSSGRLLHAWLHTHRSRFGGANHSACPAPTSACEVAQPRSPPLGLQGCCSWPRGRRWSTVPRSASRLLTASTWRRCATRASRAQRWRRRRAWSARTTRRNQTRCEGAAACVAPAPCPLTLCWRAAGVAARPRERGSCGRRLRPARRLVLPRLVFRCGGCVDGGGLLRRPLPPSPPRHAAAHGAVDVRRLAGRAQLDRNFLPRRSRLAILHRRGQRVLGRDAARGAL